MLVVFRVQARKDVIVIIEQTEYDAILEVCSSPLDVAWFVEVRFVVDYDSPEPPPPK